MPNDVDKSLMERLNALRGKGASSEKPVSTEIKVDLIERKKSPTRDDTLAARLKSLRERSNEAASPAAAPAPKKAQESPKPSQSSQPEKTPQKDVPKPSIEEDDESMFQTDDQTLEELLGDIKPEDTFSTEPDDAEVKALLEQLADAIPKDEDESKDDSDDSDGEKMGKDVDEVIARFRDEAEVEAALANTKTPEPESDDGEETNTKEGDVTLPEVPSDLNDIPSSARAGSADIDDITARLAALRAPSPDLSLPSVPTSKPSGKPVNRLTTKTNYTDDDVENWCTVCLEDATLRCPGCDDDVYCTRCWYEMHRGPQAGFDERSHKAVQFTKDKKTEKKEKKKVALGA